MRDVDCLGTCADTIRQLETGAFLTVKSGESLNTMTIGWAAFGVVWGKPILMVAVRSSRHTFGIIETAGEFTVSVPAGNMEDELACCGSRSGRDVDKFAECNLETVAGRAVGTPVIRARGRHYECRIVYRSAMDPARLDRGYDESLYPKRDYHTLYFGEVLACYETD